MRHRIHKVKLGRDRAHLKAMAKNLVTSILLYEKVKTTQAKAKLAAPKVEKLITLARKIESGKKSKREGIRQISTQVFDEMASKKLLEELTKRYADRNSGFTRIINLGFREGDAAPMVQIELVQ